MKKKITLFFYIKKCLPLLLVMLLNVTFGQVQLENGLSSTSINASPIVKAQTGTSSSFIKNMGQYGVTMKGYEQLGNIQFGYEGLDMPILFTPKGLIHLQRKYEKISHAEEERLEKKGIPEEEIERKLIITNRVITMEWVGANTNVELIAEEKTTDYHTYGTLQAKAYGYKKIIYKNLYPGIDLVYSFTTTTKLGFEYSLLLQPGADLSVVKLKYGGNVKKIKTDRKGNLIIRSDIEGIATTVPVSYYGENLLSESVGDLKAVYKLSGNEIVFSFPKGYDNTKAIVIDPFVTSTNNLTGANTGKAIDVDYDYNGNIYIAGGGNLVSTFAAGASHKHAKYNSAGVLEWTFNGVLTIPSWQADFYYGGWVVDKATGNIYIGQGYATAGFRVIRLSTTGLYDNYISTGNPAFQEAWKMYWVCNNGSPQIICAGGGTTGPTNFAYCSPPSTTLSAAVNLTGSPVVGQDMTDLIVDPVTNSLYTIYASPIDPSTGNKIYKTNPPYSFASTAWSTATGFPSVINELANRPYLAVGYNDNSSNILAQNGTYVFYWDGKHLEAFNKTTGTITGTPLTIAANALLMQGGIVADACDNVFIGNTNGTIKVYQFNGTTFDDAAAADITIVGHPTHVYDLALDESKKLVYASGDGFVASIDVAAYCPTTIYSINVVPDCSTASTSATINPVPPANSTVTYTLFNGTTQIEAINTTPSTPAVFTGLHPNITYTVVATVNVACSGLQATTNFLLPGPTITFTQTNTSCGANTGEINATGGGSPGPYAYSLDGGAFQPSGIFTGLSAGIHTLIVQGPGGCPNDTTITIVSSNGPLVTFTQTNATCGNNTGTVTTSVTGGTAPYQYSITGNSTYPYQTGNFFTGLVAGEYVLTIKDAANCTNSALVTITSSPAVIVNAIPASATCGQNNGTITAFGSGGTAPLQYSINGNTFQAGNSFSTLTPGNYTVYVKDALGCTTSVLVSVASNPLPSITVTSTTAACGNINGSITANGSGGVAPLQYSINGTTFQASPLFSGLPAGNYTVSAKDATGCIATTTVVVGSTGGPSATATSTPANCSTSNGTITITPTGTAPFTYSINGTTYQASNLFTNVAAGNYFVFVRDAFGCIGAAIVIVNPVAGPNISAVSTAASCTVNDGIITATGTGGTAPLEYSIDGVTYSLSAIFTNLAPNTYTVYVKDANGCIKTTTITVENASGLTLTLSAVSSSCGNTGILTATAGGGVAPLQYNLNAGAYQASNVFSGLAPGTYTVTVKDANNCIITKQEVIASLTGLTLNASVALQATCASNNAVISATGSGGSAPLTYSINGTTYQSSGTFLNVAPGTYTVYLKDATGCIITQSGLVVTTSGTGPGISTFTFVLKDALVCDGTLGKIQNFKVNGVSCSSCTFSLDFGPFLSGNNFIDIPPGQHYVTAMNASGCTIIVPFTINDTNGATATVAVIGSPCGSSTGQITLTGTNGDGSPPYYYSTDNGVTWVEFTTTATLTGYSPGTYTILIADDSGFDPDPPGPNCVTPLIVIVPATTGSPSLSITQVNETCGQANGSITAIGSGGSGAPFSYNLNGDPFQSSGDFLGLTAGTYTVSVMDTSGCIKTSTVTITNSGGPALTVLTSDTSCGLTNGNITVNGTGGASPYQYSIDGTVFQTSNVFNNLPPDGYTVYIKDAVGCINSTTVAIAIGSVPIVTSFTVAASCNTSDGAIFTIGSLGETPYQFSLDGSVYQSNNIFTALAAGFYTVYMKDARGCVVTTGITIGNLSAANFTTVVVAAKCGNQDGSITVTASGGTLPYTYSFDGGVTFSNSNVSGPLFPGSYTVVVQDGNGCLTTKIVFVNDTLGPQSLTAVVQEASCGLSNGTITLSAIGGTPAYEYSSDDVTYQTNNVLTGLAAGTYTVWVRDINGCKKSLTVTIINLQGATVTAVATTTSCGLSDGTITATAVGGTVPFEFSIDGGATYQSSTIFTGLPAGTYSVVVNDARGCTSNAVSIEVEVFGGSLSPTINCGAYTTSSVTFDWGAVVGATGYEVVYQINTDPPVTIGAIGNVLTYAVTGLNESDTVIITVTPTGGSGACFTAAIATCTASTCAHPTANMGPDQTICNHGTATFSVALTGVAPWNITYSNGTTQTAVTNVTTNPYVFSVNDITADETYVITALSDSNCSATPTDLTGAAVVTLINGIAGLWTGLVSNDWFDCKNWAGGLPSSTINAQIPASAIRMPIIDPATSIYAALYSNIASAQDVIIDTTASLTMATNSDLYVSSDWKNSGTFTPGQGTVTLNGATTNQIQTLNLGIKTNETFYNLTLNTSNGAKGVSLVDGYELTVSNLLSLQSGDIRLTGEAQIVQSGLVANPTSGTGKIYRDQQGTKSSFNYNYWSSPVSNNGIDYTISDIVRDGSDVTTNPFSPTTINFGAGAYFADGALSSPIKISDFWLFKYTSVSTAYADWQYVGSSGTIKVGEGFTMKGTDGIANISDPQNYVFTGKPNNGNITLSISPNQTYLVGNPYPSAIDADEFIKDNIKDGPGRNATNVINGALYFWNHFAGHTHVLASYIGGYATYTLMGGVNAISNNALINNNGATGTLVATQHIPVAQGFFIGTVLDPSLATNNPNLTTPITGGPIVFKNSQRAFKVESPTNSVFMRTQNNYFTSTVTEEEDNRSKIRLLFDAANGLHRQLLVGVDAYASDLFDLGYDAPIIDINTDDMYWEFSANKFVIQAVPDFNSDRIIPLGLKITNPGNITIKIHALENILDATEIYIFDSVTGIYHDIKNGNFTITLPVGVYTNRFSMRFAIASLSTDENVANSLIINYTSNTTSLNIQNNDTETRIEKVYLFNLLGQMITSWNLENKTNIQIPLQNISQGAYIVQVKTSNGYSSKKIIVY